MSIFILRSVFVYTRCAERTLIRIKQACCVTESHLGKRFVLQTNLCISCTTEAKVLFKICFGRKFYYQLRIRHLDVLLKI